MGEYNILDEETKPDSLAVIEAFIVTKPKIERYERIGCSISGGSDSDILIDMISKLDSEKKVKYVFFNTGIEYEATKHHIAFLQKKYGVEIEEVKAKSQYQQAAKNLDYLLYRKP